jgi:selenocysteine lyase/cysteine desulfurase
MNHHSNLLPRRESGADVVTAPSSQFGDSTGLIHPGIDLISLETILKKYKSTSLKIASLTAASNVTGITCDITQITRIFHKYGFLVFWDYAAAAPYVKIDTTPRTDILGHPDAVFFSGHKLIGGAASSGILCFLTNQIIKRLETPVVPSGGTVMMVSHRSLHSSWLRNGPDESNRI